MSAAALYADTLTAPSETTGAGIPGFVVLLDCERTQQQASEREVVEITVNNDGHLTIDRDVTLEAHVPCHFVACFSERGVLMFGAKFQPIDPGDTILLTPSGVYIT